MRAVLASNIRALMDKHYADKPNKPLALGKDCGMSKSSIERILSGDQGPSIDKIEDIAAAFEMQAYQLLIPALEIDNPQIVQGATKSEERLYKAWKRGAVLETA